MPLEYKWWQLEQSIIDKKVRKLIRIKIIVTANVQKGDFQIFLFAPKKDGSHRAILNLKTLNLQCETTHSEMESIKLVIHMVEPNMYLVLLDIKYAFYTVTIYEQHIHVVN